jgi:hypothetical protein
LGQARHNTEILLQWRLLKLWALLHQLWWIDSRLADEVLQIVSPEGVSASVRAIGKLADHHNDHQQALQRQLQQVEYEAQRAFLQYDQADPANRLVVDTLEQRWNEKLEQVEQVKYTLYAAQAAPQMLSEQDKQSIIELGKHFADTWCYVIPFLRGPSSKDLAVSERAP